MLNLQGVHDEYIVHIFPIADCYSYATVDKMVLPTRLLSQSLEFSMS